MESVQAAADEVEDFGCDLLLAALVVCKSEFGNEVLSIVGRDLHRHGTGSMLRCIGIKNDSIHRQKKYLREQFLDK